MARLKHQQTRQGVVTTFVFLRQLVNFQARFQFLNGHQAIQFPTPLGQGQSPGFGVLSRLQFAGNGLQQIAGRHQTLNHAIFIHHQDHAGRRAPELRQQLHARQGFRQKGSGYGVALDGFLRLGVQRQ